MAVKNLIVKTNETENLSPQPGVDPTANDPRYIRSWGASDPMTIPEKVDFSLDLLPDPQTKWRVLDTERRGLVNLIRAFGKNETRSIVWLKVKVNSAKTQKKKMELGFVNDVWVFLNGQLTYIDKNLQGSPIEKTPGGRLSVENTSFVLPLKEGDNELLIGVANDAAWGWGVVARLEDLQGITVAPDPAFDSRLVKISGKLLDVYTGAFKLPTGEDVTLTRESLGLRLFGEGFIDTMLYPMSENRLFSRERNLEFEFVKNEKFGVDTIVIYYESKQIMTLKRAK